MDQSRINAIRARCEAAEDNYKSVRANSELMELFHVDIPDLLAEVESRYIVRCAARAWMRRRKRMDKQIEVLKSCPWWQEPNRVLTLEEVLALLDGARVWVEHSDDDEAEKWDGEHKYIAQIGMIEGEDGGGWSVKMYPEKVGETFRVWSLPQPPTQAEMEKWPWEESQ